MGSYKWVISRATIVISHIRGLITHLNLQVGFLLKGSRKRL